MKNNFENPATSAGIYTLALRWVIGWTYFSAFWRRLILENKLIPDEAGYIGEKFNHFLPNALGIKPIIEYLVSNPDALLYSMISFTIIEAIVGLCIILGLFTRLMSIGVMMLATGILLGSGWLGTTCLDEWQIGVLGIAGGFTIFLTGSGKYSLDKYLINRNFKFSDKKWFSFLASGILPIKNLNRTVLVISIGIIGLTLYTNQYFHGGVYGKLHNKSVKPKVEISNIYIENSKLNFQLFRVEGADVYGSFLIGIQLLDEQNNIVKELNQTDLSKFPIENISNHYVSKIEPGKYSLVLPLGAKADLLIELSESESKQVQTIKLIDISGIEWSENIDSSK